MRELYTCKFDKEAGMQSLTVSAAIPCEGAELMVSLLMAAHNIVSFVETDSLEDIRKKPD